eukprot:Blabericola_migrator_1__5234@NODE_2694_length_2454_cov_19_714286_g1684_i0_p1_GENE_NODE_2694_length_2454_cov_19_714286_g1684_i0NODE_2694_length_2454_cov_19_714286_g1684_i0_p1_ORF_typecomplete_len651_score104_66_NODE_2694_length_2454_cov_19_714286_g1684_i02662218
MSARCLQVPSPLRAGDYLGLGASIVATLAIGPGIASGADLPQDNSTTGAAHDERSPDETAVADLVGAMCTQPHSSTATPTSDPASTALLDVPTSEPTDSFRSLRSSFILADFAKSLVPLFLQPRTKVVAEESALVKGVLDLYEEGKSEAAETRLREDFPFGDIEEHLLVELRERLLNYKAGTVRDWETSLYTPYVNGLKDWCANGHDELVREVQLAYKCSHASAAELRMSPAQYNAARSNHRFFEKVFDAYHDQVERLKKAAFSDKSSDLYKAWKGYRKQQNAGQWVLMKLTSYFKSEMTEDAQFVSWFLRNAPPELFLTTRLQLAEAIRTIGGDSKLVNALYLLRLHEADVTEIMNESAEPKKVKTVEDASGSTSFIRAERAGGISEEALEVFDFRSINRDFNSNKLPFFLQLVVPVEDPDVQVVNELANLCSKGKKDDAHILLRSRFPMGDFHAHFFTILRKKMRSYKLIPPRPKGLFFPSPIQTYTFTPKGPLGKLVKDYTEGLQRWCGEIYDHHMQDVEEKLMDRSVSPKALEAYNSLASELFSNMTSDLQKEWASSFLEILELPDELNECRRAVHSVSWMLLNLPWDSFLFYRLEFARLVREHNSSTGGLGFLANVLESLSFTPEDESEFHQYCQRVKQAEGQGE